MQQLTMFNCTEVLELKCSRAPWQSNVILLRGNCVLRGRRRHHMTLALRCDRQSDDARKPVDTDTDHVISQTNRNGMKFKIE